MNITDSVATQIGGKEEQIIRENKEIQIYANDNINKYQWRDGRNLETSDVWSNPTGDTRKEILEILKNHLK